MYISYFIQGYRVQGQGQGYPVFFVFLGLLVSLIFENYVDFLKLSTFPHPNVNHNKFEEVGIYIRLCNVIILLAIILVCCSNCPKDHIMSPSLISCVCACVFFSLLVTLLGKRDSKMSAVENSEQEAAQAAKMAAVKARKAAANVPNLLKELKVKISVVKRSAVYFFMCFLV
jgi:hypothetical protein